MYIRVHLVCCAERRMRTCWALLILDDTVSACVSRLISLKLFVDALTFPCTQDRFNAFQRSSLGH